MNLAKSRPDRRYPDTTQPQCCPAMHCSTSPTRMASIVANQELPPRQDPSVEGNMIDIEEMRAIIGSCVRQVGVHLRNVHPALLVASRIGTVPGTGPD
jgi:hypothetical protein